MSRYLYSSRLLPEYYVPNYIPPPRVTVVEDLSQKYRDLIDAERQHFMATEEQYNEFIAKMDAIQKELELKFADQVNQNEILFKENQEFDIKYKSLEKEYKRKKETLKKLYYVYLKVTKKLDLYEHDNRDLIVNADRTIEKNLELNNELKYISAEKTFLDERLIGLETMHRSEISRLEGIIKERDRRIIDLENELSKFQNEARRWVEENSRLKMDLDSLRMNYERRICELDMEIAHLRRLLEEERMRIIPQQTRIISDIPVVQQIDTKYYDDLINQYKLELEKANRLIEELRNRKPETIEKIKEVAVEKIKEVPIEKIVEVPVEKIVYKDRERIVYKEPEVDVVEVKRDVKVSHKYEFDMQIFIDGITACFTYVRTSIVSVIFEIFVRSSNHAYHKKINSLILFIINVNELKEKDAALLVIIIAAFMKLKKLVKINAPKKSRLINKTLSQKALSTTNKSKLIDIEFRDNTNLWIEETLEQTKRRKAYDEKTDKKNADNLYLFRLLSIKYRCVYPLRGKSFVVDSDLIIKLENKICKALLTVLEKKDEEEFD